MNGILSKNINRPDETRTLPKTNIDVVTVGHTTIMRVIFEPGWKWSECIKPTAGTDSCEVLHINYIISGNMKVVMDNGTEKELIAGDFAVIPPGHDAWVVGNEPCIALDFSGGNFFGKE